MSRGTVAIPAGRHFELGALPAVAPGASLDCLVLATGPPEAVLVDIKSGAYLRTHNPTQFQVTPLEVITVVLGTDPDPIDPARPEAVVIASAPRRLGRPRLRDVEALLTHLVTTPRSRLVLGSLARSIPYPECDRLRASVELLEPDGEIDVESATIANAGANGARCRFCVEGAEHVLPLADRAVEATLEGSKRQRLRGADLGAALGGAPRYLVTVLAAPSNGYVQKVVAQVLPEPKRIQPQRGPRGEQEQVRR
jgi:hypothetical protein